MPHASPGVRSIGIAASTVAVLAWKVVAFLHPSSFIEIEPRMRLPLAGLGLLFVAAGIVVHSRCPGRIGRLFLMWTLCAGIHWGGAIGSDSEAGALFWLLAYLGLSVTGDTLLLILALDLPDPWWARPEIRRALIVPGLAGLTSAPLAFLLPPEVTRLAIVSLFAMGSLLGVATGAIFLIRFAQSLRAHRPSGRLGLVVGCLLLPAAASFLGSAIGSPGSGEILQLLYALVPIGLGYAVVRWQERPV